MVDTTVEPGARTVTFANGLVVREPIITLDDASRRLVWSVEGIPMTHYNASVQVSEEPGGTLVTWMVDFLPDDAAARQDAVMTTGMGIMQQTLDKLASAA